MWIIPSNLPLFSAFAPECAASKEDLNALSDQLEQSLMWKSKPLSSKTWSAKWNRVYWLQHLFGRTLKPSQQSNFTTKYTESLADIHVNPSPLPENGPEPKTPATYGPQSCPLSAQLTLFRPSSKTSPDTSPWDTNKSETTYSTLVTRLNKEYYQRKKLALRTKENDSSSWLWTTPVSTDLNRNTQYQQGGTALSLQVKNWPTPRSSEYKGTGPKGSTSQKYRLEKKYLDATVEELSGPPAQVNPNIHGKRHVLNPAWVMQLMGTTIEKTFFEWQATQSLNSPLNSPSNTSSENTSS
jgi:hypothetical protein